jgi:hypothetical protein
MTKTLPPARPVLWPLRSIDTAKVNITQLSNGCRKISIQHAELKDVTPEMLAWWYQNVVGEMEYAGQILPRYLVWHPLDHISYSIIDSHKQQRVVKGTRLHIREAFQRDPSNLLDIRVTVQRIDSKEAVVVKRTLGLKVLELSNQFETSKTGSFYTTIMTIGTNSWLSKLGINKIFRSIILPGEKARAWAKHHIEEIGNLENFLPQLYKSEVR